MQSRWPFLALKSAPKPWALLLGKKQIIAEEETLSRRTHVEKEAVGAAVGNGPRAPRIAYPLGLLGDGCSVGQLVLCYAIRFCLAVCEGGLDKTCGTSSSDTKRVVARRMICARADMIDASSGQDGSIYRIHAVAKLIAGQTCAT
jgi:hypothetical protein